jgi:3',5'-cyclic AMP phosphodiesterase CpdA
VHFGDLFLTGHRGTREGLPCEETLARALGALDRMEKLHAIDFLLFSGNLTAGMRPSDARVLASFLRHVSGRWRVVPGVVEARGVPLGKSEFLHLAKGHDRPFWSWRAARNVRVVGIDTTGDGQSSGVVDEEQLAFLRAEVDAHPHECLLVLTHHPPLAWDDLSLPESFRETHSIENAEEFRFVLEAGGNIKLVLSGHRLRNAVRTSSGIHYITTPSPSLYPAAFREVRVQGRRAKLIYHPVLGSVESARAREKLIASQRARLYNPQMPSTYTDMVLGSARDREGELSLR